MFRAEGHVWESGVDEQGDEHEKGAQQKRGTGNQLPVERRLVQLEKV